MYIDLVSCLFGCHDVLAPVDGRSSASNSDCIVIRKGNCAPSMFLFVSWKCLAHVVTDAVSKPGFHWAIRGLLSTINAQFQFNGCIFEFLRDSHLVKHIIFC